MYDTLSQSVWTPTSRKLIFYHDDYHYCHFINVETLTYRLLQLLHSHVLDLNIFWRSAKKGFVESDIIIIKKAVRLSGFKKKSDIINKKECFQGKQSYSPKSFFLK